MDCFQSQSTVNICIAGLNRRAGYATGDSNFAYWSWKMHDIYRVCFDEDSWELFARHDRKIQYNY